MHLRGEKSVECWRRLMALQLDLLSDLISDVCLDVGLPRPIERIYSKIPLYILHNYLIAHFGSCFQAWVPTEDEFEWK